MLLSCVDDGLLKFQIRHTTVISGVAVKCCNGLAHRDIREAHLSCGVGIVIGLRTREAKGGQVAASTNVTQAVYLATLFCFTVRWPKPSC